MNGSPGRSGKPLNNGNDGGESGIRTRVTVSRKHTFQACAFNHSATSPHSLVARSVGPGGLRGKRTLGQAIRLMRRSVCSLQPAAAIPVSPRAANCGRSGVDLVDQPASRKPRLFADASGQEIRRHQRSCVGFQRCGLPFQRRSLEVLSAEAQRQRPGTRLRAGSL
jgi:hypothetical protein